MMKAERRLLRDLVALDVFDQYVFPHQQTQRDATRMQLALDRLAANDPEGAREYVRRTGLTSAGRHFAYETYTAELARHDPDADRLQWGSQAHLAPYVDLWQEYHSMGEKIADGKSNSADFADEITSIGTKLQDTYVRMNERLETMGATFDRATAHLRVALRAAG
jgi:hypothetical protein